MVDPKVLEQFNTTNDRLREVFSEWDGRKTDGKPHKKLRELIRSRCQEGWTWSLRHAHHFTAADLAWDGSPILPENIPLMLYAQGKLKLESCIQQLENLQCADRFLEETVCEKDGREETVKTLNLSKFVEVAVQIIRSYTSRRVFAQTNKYNSQSPFLPYESRFQNQIGKLRAALMSQYAEIMSNAYAYPHAHTQAIRHMFLYCEAIVFAMKSWDDERQTVRDGPKGADGKYPVKTRIVREGVPFESIHRSRTFYDTAHPLSSLNSDTGCEWVGFWSIWRFSQIDNNADFFNRDKVKFSRNFQSLYSQFSNFFALNFASDPISLKVPDSVTRQSTSLTRMAEMNDRAIAGSYYEQGNPADHDTSIALTDIRMKLVPRDWDLGDYPNPVWLRLLVASDETVVFAEWLPSRPAFVFSFNANDSRLLNQSPVHEMMWAQDQVSNLMSQLLLVMKQSLLQIIAINTDILDPETVKKIKRALQGDKYFEKPHLLTYSFSKLEQDIGIKISDAVVNIVQAKAPEGYINQAFSAIAQILAIMERLMLLSPQEQGQPSPRETSATENAMIESTTQAVSSAISNAIEEGRAAMKTIIYESAMAHGSNEINLPVAQTFSRKTIEQAGLKIMEPEEEEGADTSVRNKTYTVVGTKDALEHNYAFTVRDVGDRPTNQQSAQTLIALLGQVIPLIGPEAFGKERLYEMINEVFRLVGVYSLRLDIGENESTDLPAEKLAQQIQQQIIPALQQLAQQGGENKQEIEAIVQQIQKLAKGLDTVSQMAEAGQQQGLPPAAPAVQPGFAPEPSPFQAAG